MNLSVIAAGFGMAPFATPAASETREVRASHAAPADAQQAFAGYVGPTVGQSGPDPRP